jgi:hypothetical protein
VRGLDEDGLVDRVREGVVDEVVRVARLADPLLVVLKRLVPICPPSIVATMTSAIQAPIAIRRWCALQRAARAVRFRGTATARESRPGEASATAG